ncbi:acyl-CoA dehydrogenase family protein [Haladaptatus sp. DYSN1]|uniref:acyl-CoA dehydrogenase family protein n=1 Tax=unclassified Haladaptatus TaxID=2622732 RepID=UPI0024070665|nr:acyl-CoA dehydrogenase family protein [Haladaptatus sp. DYSN1]
MPESPIDYSKLEEGRHVNYWELDRTVQFEARRTYPDADFEWAEPRLADFGAVVGNTIADNADVIDKHGPELHTFSKHGEVVNDVEYHPEQAENERLAYGAGIVADSFEAPDERTSALGLTHNLTMDLLLSYADPGFTCPVAMTAGVALVLQKFGDGDTEQFYEGLTSKDPEKLLEGAMFLTEKQGGSDVGANATIAEEAEDGTYRLTGEKWFCSNIDAQATLVLARRPDAPEGTKGLSLFLVPHRLDDGELNDAVYRRLKDKLGTISVPTGEVEFHGATGYLIGKPESGFRYMTEMLNLERLSNAFASVGVMGRCLLESKIHAANREAFGSTIDEYPLMRRDLVDMAVDHEAAAAFAFEAARQLDIRERSDGEKAEAAFKALRVLTPIAKYKTGRMAVDTASYACEVLGGNGYVEEFVTPRLLRDAQVLPIWEGTSNILSLDVLRGMAREQSHEGVIELVQGWLDDVDHTHLEGLKATVESEFERLQAALGTLATEDEDYAQLQAKRLADYIFDVVTAALLLSEAQWQLDEEGNARKALVAERFVETRFDTRPARGITSGSKFAIEHFDAIVRYGAVEPTALVDAAPADD